MISAYQRQISLELYHLRSKATLGDAESYRRHWWHTPSPGPPQTYGQTSASDEGCGGYRVKSGKPEPETRSWRAEKKVGGGITHELRLQEPCHTPLPHQSPLKKCNFKYTVTKGFKTATLSIYPQTRRPLLSRGSCGIALVCSRQPYLLTISTAYLLLGQTSTKDPSHKTSLTILLWS